MAGTDAAATVAKITDALDALRKITAQRAVNADGEKQEKLGPETALVAAARRAKASYQKTARSVLVAFAAVGALIFGSLPFANLAGANLSGTNGLWLVGCLTLAAIGIVAAIIAVSLVNEPEDASLGELDLQLRKVQKVTPNGEFEFDKEKPKFQGRMLWLRKLWNPRRQARMDYCEIVHGCEAAAHLGPGLDGRPTVTHLINKLADLEVAKVANSPKVAKLSVMVEIKAQCKDELRLLLDDLRKRRIELIESNASAGEVADLANRLAGGFRLYHRAALDLLEVRSSLADVKQQLAETEDELALYRHCRTVVLVESSVMQMRGTFRLARRILAVAAVLTLIGGAGYGIMLPKSDAKAASVGIVRSGVAAHSGQFGAVVDLSFS